MANAAKTDCVALEVATDILSASLKMHAIKPMNKRIPGTPSCTPHCKYSWWVLKFEVTIGSGALSRRWAWLNWVFQFPRPCPFAGSAAIIWEARSQSERRIPEDVAVWSLAENDCTSDTTWFNRLLTRSEVKYKSPTSTNGKTTTTIRSLLGSCHMIASDKRAIATTCPLRPCSTNRTLIMDRADPAIIKALDTLLDAIVRRCHSTAAVTALMIPWSR